MKYNFYMKKSYSLTLLIIFVLALIINGVLYAQSYESCGTKPGFLTKLLTDAEKIRIKCINDIFDANREKAKKELEELYLLQNSISEELKKVAIKVDYNIVICSPRNGEPARNPNLIKQCHELLKTKNALIDRIRELTEWQEAPITPTDAKMSLDKAAPPCPSKEKLDEIKGVRMFNRKLYQTWERCVSLDPTNYYQ